MAIGFLTIIDHNAPHWGTNFLSLSLSLIMHPIGAQTSSLSLSLSLIMHPTGAQTSSLTLSLSLSLSLIMHPTGAQTSSLSLSLSNAYRKINPEIILINSHGNHNDHIIKIFNYDVIHFNSTGERNDGSAICVKKGNFEA